MHGESRERPQHAIIKKDRKGMLSSEKGKRVERRGKDIEGARGGWIRRVEEELGNDKGEAEGEDGKEAALRSGSDVQERGVHLQDWTEVAVKLSEHCHHLLTTGSSGLARV